jgi:hypothetical protein
MAEDRHELRQSLAHIAIDCLVTINLIASVIDRYPSEVQENFYDKMQELIERLSREQEEFMNFGEGWDNHVEGE